ncbi:MAG: MFS transporter [Thermoleophilia bacterium]|nr:MFS transporter [Thermoleophilia bacterium]
MEQSRQKAVLISTAFAGFVSTFMMSSINIALPLIQTEFNVSAVVLGWMGLSFILATGAILMPMGRLGDLYGRKRLFLIGVVLFTIVTFAGAFAPSEGTLLVIRVLQGLASALIFATNTAMVTLAFPQEKRGRALGIQVAGVYIGLTLGPVLGGVISHHLGWRGLFWVSGILSLANCLVPIIWLRGVEWKEPRRGAFDVFGSAVWAVALSALLLGFSYLPGLTGGILIAAGVVGIALFLWWESHAADPVLNVSLLRRNPVFLFSNLASLINYASTAAMTFLMSLYLQYNRSLDPQTAGLVLVTGTAIQAAFSPAAGRLTDRVQPRLVATGGMTLCTIGLIAFAFLSANTPYWYIITTLCILGLGYAFFASPITNAIMSSVEKRYVGLASATLATMRVTGQTMSIGLATLVLAVVVGRHAIGPADYPNLLTSARISFTLFAAMCVLGVAASRVKANPDGLKGNDSPPSTQPLVLYKDRWIECTEERLIIDGYYFPFGNKKTIPYHRIKSVSEVTIGPATGQWRIWGSSDFRHYFHLDPKRPHKTRALVLDVGKFIRPVITPEDTDQVKAILASKTGQQRSDSPPRS